jgi:hypothetical protein
VVRYNSPLINANVLKGGVLQVTEEGKEHLRKCLLGKVSYIKANSDTNPLQIEKGNELIPNRKGTSNVVYCQMSQDQYVSYLYALKNDIKSDSKYDIASAIQNLEASENIQEDNVVSKTGSLYKHSSDASTMTYPGNTFGKEGFLKVFENASGKSCKIKQEYKNLLKLDGDLRKFSTKLFKLLKNVNSSPGIVFIYSNYVSYGGTSLLRQLFLNNGYVEFKPNNAPKGNAFIMYDESNNVETRERYRRLFNSPENKDGKMIKIIIGSPIISEGVTLKNVRQVHILEPSWNMSRTNQIIGRAVRNYSHHDLEQENRNVEIYKYVSVYYPKIASFQSLPSNSLQKFFIDREKYVLSEEKDHSNKAIERILKETSFDCELMKHRNQVDNQFDGTAQCDYENCNYTCDIHLPTNTHLDMTTYNLNIDFFDKYDIQFILGTLRSLFQMYFVWKLDDIVEEIRKRSANVSNEAIFTTLGHIVKNKTLFTDMYNRDGFIMNTSDFYIFNCSDIDIHSSIFAKTLDFSKDITKYNLSDYIKIKFDQNLQQKPQKKAEEKVVQLSDEDLKYNLDIVQNNLIYGTYRQRGTQNNPIGKRDGVFRIVDNRHNTNEDDTDNRTQKSGKNAKSFDKSELVDIAGYLKIKVKSSVSIMDFEKDQLANLIEKFLIAQKKILQ